MAINLSDFKGSYALITGGSSGLGKAFAEQFASLGINVILVARDLHTLKLVAREITDKYQIDVRLISLDLSGLNASEKLQQQLSHEKIKIRILCNNVANGFLGDFCSEPLLEIQNRIVLNQASLVSMCRVFFDDLASYKRSVVINVSSAAAFQPVPRMALYAATKAFVHSFSQALHWEWKSSGIYVQTLTPGAIDTDFNSKIGMDMSRIKGVKSAQSVVTISLQALAREKVVVEAANGILLQKFFANFFPALFVLKTVAQLFQSPRLPQ